MWDRIHKVFLLTFTMKIMSACSPTLQTPSEINQKPVLYEDKIIAGDGVVLPLKSWTNEAEKPIAVVLALHGFNDYSNGWDQAATIWVQDNIWTYAYDQRGFGGTVQRGIWAGQDKYVEDTHTALALLKEKHPDTPIFLMGHSMGGAISILSATSSKALNVNGVILVAPAVLIERDVPWYQRAIVEFFSVIAPSWKPNIRFEKKASDNREMLIEMFQDPMVIKNSRVDTGYFLFELMIEADKRAKDFTENALILYGDKEEIVPAYAVNHFLDQLPKGDKKNWSLIRYKDGYHMLTRDLNGDQVSLDIAKYIIENSTL